MDKRLEGRGPGLSSSKDSLFLLAQELKHPLTAIAQASELGNSELVRQQAQRALRTLDAIVLGEQVAAGQVGLDLKPLQIGSVMVDVHQQIQPMLKTRSINAEISLRRGLALIDSDRLVVSTILTSLWHVMISAVGSSTDISFSAKSYKGGVRVSLSSKSAKLSGLNKPRTNLHSSQPIKELASGAGDFLAASQLASLLGTKLTASPKSIGVLLPKSSQLTLV